MSGWRLLRLGLLQLRVRWRHNQPVSATPLDRLRDGTWRSRPVPLASAGVTTMLNYDELRLLEALTEDYWSDAGMIVDAGCFLGGSTVAMASGLRKRGIANRKLIHSYDLFEVEDWTRGVFFPQTVRAGDPTRPLYERNIAPLADLVAVHEGDITLTQWCGEPIEILFIDVAKHWTVCDWITTNLFPHLISGKSVVVQQDFLCHWWTGWLHITMEYFADYFERICDTEVNSVVFLHTKAFPQGALKLDLVSGMSREQHIELLDGAAARFSGEQAKYLHQAKAHFLEIFDYGR